MLSFGGPIQAAQDPGAQLSLEPFHEIDLQQMEGFRRELTLRCIDQLRDPGFQKLLETRLGPDQTRISLSRLVSDWAELWPDTGHQQFSARIQELDQDLRQRMGIERTARSILGLQVVWPRQGAQRLDWNRTLFAVRPQPRGGRPAYVEAYDSRGRMVRLDPDQAPGVPVLMAGVDRPEAVRAGLETVNQGLRQAGFSSEHRAMDLQDAIPCAKLTSIRIAHGQEPWWRDGLEIYAVVSGVDPVEPKPNLKLVDMPYVRHEATGYAPDHIILFWTDYRFSAANIQFFDHGDGTNYQELLDALLKAVASAMVAGGAPLYAWIPALADAVLEAMPASWRTDSDTWLDTFYTLEKDQTYLDRDGAARAVRISLVPWLLHPSE